MKQRSFFERLFNIHDSTDTGVWIRSTRSLRQLIGVLGMALPILLIVFSDCKDIPLESISHYYYTRAGDFFTVILSLIGIFLIFYTKDFWLSTVAGVSILLVVFFPTSPLEPGCSIVDIPVNTDREALHYIAAAVFLIILALMAIFYFPKQDEEDKMMNHAVKYKGLYISCGIIMFLAFGVLGARILCVYLDLGGYQAFHDAADLTFWMETVALEAFGLAWLVKGRSTVKYSEYKSFMEGQSKPQ